MEADYALVMGGLDVAKRSVDQIVALMRVMYDFVLTAKNERSVSPLMGFLYLNLSQTLERIGELNVACRKGCSHCCHNWVAASAPEVIYALKYAEAAGLPVQDNLSSTLMLTGGRNSQTRIGMRAPCPLLDGDVCGVYENRPIVCRTLVSFDAGICERFYSQITKEPVPASAAYNAIRNVYALCLAGALKRAGLPPFFYEYNAALNNMAQVDDAEAAWLSGEDILEGVMLDDGGDMFCEAWNRDIYKKAFG